jgi:hypothetical protein
LFFFFLVASSRRPVLVDSTNAHHVPQLSRHQRTQNGSNIIRGQWLCDTSSSDLEDYSQGIVGGLINETDVTSTENNGCERGVREIDSNYFAMDTSYLFSTDLLNLSFNDKEPRDGGPTLTSVMLPSPYKSDRYEHNQ